MKGSLSRKHVILLESSESITPSQLVHQWFGLDESWRPSCVSKLLSVGWTEQSLRDIRWAGQQKDFKSPWTFTVSDVAVVRDQKRELERKRVEDKEKYEMGICFADAHWQCVREIGYALRFHSADHADEMSLGL